MPRQICDVATQRGQGRAELVRRVGEKAALEIPRALEARQHRIESLRQPPDLVMRRGRWQAATGIAGPLDLGRGVGKASDRPERTPKQERHAQRRERRGGEAGEHEKKMEVAERSTHVSLGCGDDYGAAGGRTAEVRERGRVKP